ncbi:hypothetical protein GmHk_10G028680 [Glycine max]|nr:hypothetical protein GmHk_10G028680 [Glycine max]
MVRSRMDKMQAICTTNKHSDEAWFLWKWRKLFGIQHNNLSSSDQSAVSGFAKKVLRIDFLLTAFFSGGSDTKIETEEGKESTQQQTSIRGKNGGRMLIVSGNQKLLRPREMCLWAAQC